MTEREVKSELERERQRKRSETRDKGEGERDREREKDTIQRCRQTISENQRGSGRCAG